ncbi:hypothetical protein [Pelagibacterium halotolerans]|uniref:hypothetical protein n=1 Tax=Pelagibacterium halotolerans TaxID=531813 RepID=UPI00384B62F2
MNGTKVGTGNDVWLVKGTIGARDPVGLVFGYLDDFAACLDIANGLMLQFPSASYYCEYADQ